MKDFERVLVFVISSCFVMTGWGTMESIFGRDELVDPSGVKIGRGGIPPDPGSKAAGFLVRKYVKDSQKILAISASVEPPVLFYYFGRSQYSFFDLSSKRAIEKFYELKHEVDVVVCDPGQASFLESDPSFVKRAIIFSESEPRMLIYTRLHVEMPVTAVDVNRLNSAFDREYAWRVGLI